MRKRRARTLRFFKRYAPTTIGLARGWTAALVGAMPASNSERKYLIALPNGFLGPGKTFCAHAPGAVEPLGSAIKYFRSEFEAGIAPARAGDLNQVVTPTMVGA